MRNLPIKTKLICLIAFMSTMLVAVGGLGLSGMKSARDSLETVYKDRLIPVIQLAAIGELLSDTRREVLLSVAHGRSNSSNLPMQYPVTAPVNRAARIEANLAEMDKIWREYLATYLTPEEKLLASSVLASYTALVEKGIKPGIVLMRDNDIAGLDAHLKDIVLPLDSKSHEALDALIRLQDKVARTELARNASDYRVRLTISVIGIALAVLVGIVISAITIRSVTAAANRLMVSERRFRTLFEQATVGVAEIDPLSGRFLHVNKRYCDIVGLSRNEMLKTDFQSITHPEDLAADLNKMKLLLAGEIREFSMEKRYIRKDGGIVWVNLTVYPTWL